LTYAEGLLFPLGYSLSSLARRRADWWKWALGQSVVVLGLVVSQSRGPWIAAAVMVLFVCFLLRDPVLVKRLAFVYLPITLCFLSPSLRARAFTITSTAYESNAERLDMWRAGRRMVWDHPLLGIGPGNMNLASPLYQSAKRRADGPWGHLHDTYIHIAAERGLLGLLAFLGFILVLASELWRGYRVAVVKEDADSKLILLTALLSLGGWLVAGFTETVYHDSNVLMMFYFVMGIAVATSRRLLQDLKRM
jgi:putative inorganic carbon (HCO3(-)) transporter